MIGYYLEIRPPLYPATSLAVSPIWTDGRRPSPQTCQTSHPYLSADLLLKSSPLPRISGIEQDHDCEYRALGLKLVLPRM